MRSGADLTVRGFWTENRVTTENPVTGRCEKIDFAEISSEPKCMPQAQRSLIRDPGTIFFKAEIAPRF
jgi:hypothetical protein